MDKGLESMIKLHENLMGRQVTYYEYRLIRSVYYSTLAQVKGGKDNE